MKGVPDRRGDIATLRVRSSIRGPWRSTRRTTSTSLNGAATHCGSSPRTARSARWPARASEGDATGPALQSQFGSPKHLAVDARDAVYIADDQNARIVKYDPQKETVTTVLGTGAAEPNHDLSHPHGVCVHADGSLYVVDTGHDRIIRLVD